MTHARIRKIPATALVAVAVLTITPAHSQTARFDKLANAEFAENRPTAASAQMLRDELLFQRATQAYLWALPLINTLGSCCF